jgi:hypothetical protein
MDESLKYIRLLHTLLIGAAATVTRFCVVGGGHEQI